MRAQRVGHQMAFGRKSYSGTPGPRKVCGQPNKQIFQCQRKGLQLIALKIIGFVVEKPSSSIQYHWRLAKSFPQSIYRFSYFLTAHYLVLETPLSREVEQHDA